MNHLTLRLGSLCVLASLAPAQKIQVFGGTEARQVTRVFYYSTPSEQEFKMEGQLCIDYGQPAWKKEYEDKEQFDKMTRGKRWRLGAGPWTRLDTNVALSIGDKKINPGDHYLILERSKDDQISLIVLDPAPLRNKKVDAFAADQLAYGTRLPMKWTQEKDSVEKMTITLTADKNAPEKVTMVIRFGPHKLALAITAQIGQKKKS